MNKKYFSLDLNQPKYNILGKEEKTLVDAGFKLVKKYASDLGKKENKKSFIELIEDDSGIDNYKQLNNKFLEKLVKFSLKTAGCDVADFTINQIANPMLNKKTMFVETFQAVLAQVLAPVIPAMISAEFADLADSRNIAYGDTARFVVKSNDTFVVTRQAEGINEGTIQRIYHNELTVNPEPFSIKTAVDWYHIASGIFDFGEFAYRCSQAYSHYINSLIVVAIQKDIEAGLTSSLPYFTDGFTTQKFVTLSEKVSVANNRSSVKAYGTLSALSAILPSGAAGSTIANLQVGLGEQWASVGYLAKYMGIDLIRIPQIMLPNTVNTSALFGLPNDVVFFFADGGYKPVKLVFEGQPVTIQTEPTNSSDKQMGINVGMRIGYAFVAASKYGAMTGVSLT